MLDNLDDLLRAVDPLYPGGLLPRPFRVLSTLELLKQGTGLGEIARSVRSTRTYLQSLANSTNPIATVLGADLQSARQPPALTRARNTLGQLILGVLAERAFEGIYKSTMGRSDLSLEDERKSRTETDFRVLNGRGRPVFRINIKFHGTLFRNAATLVGLEPEDCFALATYKIHQALLKQEEEVLPYIFAIVGVPGLTGEHVGKVVPEDLAHLIGLVQASRISGKREVEDRAVLYLTDPSRPGAVRRHFDDFYSQIERAEWRVLSARRADKLLREKLFDRVYAVRVRAFARNYRNAELDMHFSLNEDLTPLKKFLSDLKQHGLHGLTARLERGLI